MATDERAEQQISLVQPCRKEPLRSPREGWATALMLRSQLARCLEVLCVSLLRTLWISGLLLTADFAAKRVGLLEGNLLASDVWAFLKWQWTGVFATESVDLVKEAQAFAAHLQLTPGMTLCEMGSADGTLMALVGKHVMPGGHLIATAPSNAELAATTAAVAAAGLGKVRTFRATKADWAPGLQPRACDAIYSRMVIHMVDQHVIKAYIPQWAASLKLGGRMFMTDHNSDDGVLTGPPRPIQYKFRFLPMMYVLPQDTEVAMITLCKDPDSNCFKVLDGPFEHPFYQGGYGVLYMNRSPSSQI